MTDLIAGRYRLIAPTGHGGMGEVWRAFDERLARDVAIKLLHPDVASQPDMRLRLRREAAALGRLRHPNIVAVLDVDDTADRPFLVMEYCGGGTLAGLLSAGPLPWERTRVIGLAIARALAHAHAQGVVHRDLKPSNVLFADDGQLRVADFGIARLLEASEDGGPTSTGMRIGSPEYWSPEQASGEPAAAPSDMYSLGCLLFALVSGRPPFEGEDRVATGYRRVHEAAPSLRKVVPDVPIEVQALVDALLRRDPATRPTAKEVELNLAVEMGSADAETTEILDGLTRVGRLRRAHGGGAATVNRIAAARSRSGRGRPGRHQTGEGTGRTRPGRRTRSDAGGEASGTERRFLRPRGRHPRPGSRRRAGRGRRRPAVRTRPHRTAGHRHGQPDHPGRGDHRADRLRRAGHLRPRRHAPHRLGRRCGVPFAVSGLPRLLRALSLVLAAATAALVVWLVSIGVRADLGGLWDIASR